MELSFNETRGGVISDAVELNGNAFGLHLEFDEVDNKIEVYRKVGGSKYVSAKSVSFVGKVFDVTFTDALPGMSIMVKCNNLPEVAEILE